MPHLAPDRPFTLIHVGKCGGGSVLAALRTAGYRVEHVHLQRPADEADCRYVVLVRDPVARFVSAFNWRRHLYLNGGLPPKARKGRVADLRHYAEREFIFEFETVNSLAEQLSVGENLAVSPASALLPLIGHVPQGFDWYLRDLIDKIKPEQLAGVICTENLAADFEHLFGFPLEQGVHRSNANASKHVSKNGRGNLAREFFREYVALEKLARLAHRANVRMSMRYDPALGAVPDLPWERHSQGPNSPSA